jgi:hypothetical protein
MRTIVGLASAKHPTQAVHPDSLGLFSGVPRRHSPAHRDDGMLPDWEGPASGTTEQCRTDEHDAMDRGPLGGSDRG